MTTPLLLLVDDSTEMGLIVASLGKRAGWEVTVGIDAATAWTALSRCRPDLVLLDVNLPGTSGPDWLRRVRAAPRFADLSVALYTHWGLSADVAAGLDAGADFVFDKDLAARPADWQRRLMEIWELVPVAWQARNPPNAWPAAINASRIEARGDDSRSSVVRIAGLNQALRHPSLHCLTPIVMRSVLGKALSRTFARGDLQAWIAADGSGLNEGRLAPSIPPGALMVLSVCLMEQMRRLLGAEASTAFRDALTSAVPGLSEFLAGS